jgi:hypothetical protein
MGRYISPSDNLLRIFILDFAMFRYSFIIFWLFVYQHHKGMYIFEYSKIFFKIRKFVLYKSNTTTWLPNDIPQWLGSIYLLESQIILGVMMTPYLHNMQPTTPNSQFGWYVRLYTHQESHRCIEWLDNFVIF